MIKKEVLEKLSGYENRLSKYAVKSRLGIRFQDEKSDFRGAFSRDADRIIHSLSYTRFVDKTQVFSFSENGNISKRMTHINQVSKIGRTIGRALGLNEDLIEAGALGHDLGHVPYGHIGERILNEISLENDEGYFNHNVQSVRTLMILEEKNLCLQTLDAILCHNGKMLAQKNKPHSKTKEEFLSEIANSYSQKDYTKGLISMSLEGIVVRFSDIIAYLGRDIEDAELLDMFQSKDLPDSIKTSLGTTNKEIINTLVTDIINNSFEKPYISMSKKVFDAMKELKIFNYNNIYKYANSEKEIEIYEKQFRQLFNTYLNDIKNKNYNSNIYHVFLNNRSQHYLDETSDARKVIDYIAGMTDNFFIKSLNCDDNN